LSETSYTPGTWLGIVGERATVLLPPTEKARAGAIWALVDGGAGFDEVLDALVADGLRNLPGFVLVAADDDATRVVVRGSAKATFQTSEGSVDVDGSSASTWAERALRGVTHCVVDLGEGSGAPSYVVSAGLVRVGGIEVPPAAAPSSSAPSAAVVAVPPVEYGDESPDSLADEPVDIAAPRREGPAAPALSLVPPAPPVPPTPPVPPVPLDQPKDYAPDAPLIGHDPLTDPLLGADGWEPTGAQDDETQNLPLGSSAPAAPAPADEEEASASPAPDSAASAPLMPPPPPPPPSFAAGAGAPGFPPPPPPPPLPVPGAPVGTPPAFAPPMGHDAPAAPGGPAASERGHGEPGGPAATSHPVARLEFSSGQRVDVDRVVVVGRAPEAGRFSHSEQPLLVTVPSPHQEISSTHLEVRPGTGVDHGAAVATDLGSTNGTVLVQPGMSPEELRPGVPVQLMPGAVIDLGDGLQIHVLDA